MGADEVREFLTFLAVKRNASLTTHRVALSKQGSQRAFEPMVSSRQIATLARVTEHFSDYANNVQSFIPANS